MNSDGAVTDIVIVLRAFLTEENKGERGGDNERGEREIEGETDTAPGERKTIVNSGYCFRLATIRNTYLIYTSIYVCSYSMYAHCTVFAFSIMFPLKRILFKSWRRTYNFYTYMFEYYSNKTG
jgi:hypothetical protein